MVDAAKKHIIKNKKIQKALRQNGRKTTLSFFFDLFTRLINANNWKST